MGEKEMFMHGIPPVPVTLPACVTHPQAVTARFSEFITTLAIIDFCAAQFARRFELYSVHFNPPTWCYTTEITSSPPRHRMLYDNRRCRNRHFKCSHFSFRITLLTTPTTANPHFGWITNR